MSAIRWKKSVPRRNLDALSTFVQSQRTLLAQTLADIDRLKELRHEIASQPANMGMVPHFVDQINASASKLSDNIDDIVPLLPDDFDWSIFASQDPAPFKALASCARQAYDQRNIPKEMPLASPTPLQRYVREQKRLIIDPVIASLPVLSSDSEDEPPDPEEIKKLQEREKIRDLKKRRIDGGSGFGGLGLRKPSAGVFIRMDQVDESGEVDISGGDNLAVGRQNVKTSPEVVSSSEPSSMMDGDTPPTSIPSPSLGYKSWPLPESSTAKSSRQRRPSRKAAATAATSRVQSSRGKAKQVVTEEAEDILTNAEEPDTKPSSELLLDKKGKPRPETYKQAWSVSEQHLLERLLEEIPDGEKNRWAKISRAMNGRRTARQVASRVQKYYEKLKRFGVELGSS
ncbi:unnamed protein product [Somion occarium]|uniref:Uncharacterized protein n=1 Tax=Somion occarium TaxID=3059160 RepID=A0ABP1DT91_9APHY